MLIAILLILIVLWFLGYGPIEAFYVPLFRIGGNTITIWDILIFVVVLGVINLLPSPIREIAIVLLIIWLLSVIGILAVSGLSSMIVIAIIVGVILALISG